MCLVRDDNDCIIVRLNRYVNADCSYDVEAKMWGEESVIIVM